jgi:hypothetical protein
MNDAFHPHSWTCATKQNRVILQNSMGSVHIPGRPPARSGRKNIRCSQSFRLGGVFDPWSVSANQTPASIAQKLIECFLSVEINCAEMRIPHTGLRLLSDLMCCNPAAERWCEFRSPGPQHFGSCASLYFQLCRYNVTHTSIQAEFF